MEIGDGGQDKGLTQSSVNNNRRKSLTADAIMLLKILTTLIAKELVGKGVLKATQLEPDDQIHRGPEYSSILGKGKQKISKEKIMAYLAEIKNKRRIPSAEELKNKKFVQTGQDCLWRSVEEGCTREKISREL